MLQIGRSLVRSHLVSLEFFTDIKSFRSRYGLWVRSVPGAFSGGKGGRCVRLTTLPTSYAVVVKSGNLNFLEPSGPLQVCNGTDYLLSCSFFCKIQFYGCLPLLFVFQHVLYSLSFFGGGCNDTFYESSYETVFIYPCLYFKNFVFSYSCF